MEIKTLLLIIGALTNIIVSPIITFKLILKYQLEYSLSFLDYIKLIGTLFLGTCSTVTAIYLLTIILETL